MLNEVFQIAYKDYSIKEIINNSRLTKKEIANRMGISEQWLNKLLKKDDESWSIIQLRLLLKVLGYTLKLNIHKNN